MSIPLVRSNRSHHTRSKGGTCTKFSSCDRQAREYRRLVIFYQFNAALRCPAIHRRGTSHPAGRGPIACRCCRSRISSFNFIKAGVFCWSHACRSVVRYSFACPAAQRLRRFAAANQSTRPLPLSCFKLKSGVHDVLQAPSQHSGGWL